MAETTTTEQETRGQILDDAKQCICHDRQDAYGNPENCFKMIAKLWSDYLNGSGFDPAYEERSYLRPEHVAHMMILLKVARQVQGAGKLDNMVDAAGYAAIAGELWGEQRRRIDLLNEYKNVE